MRFVLTTVCVLLLAAIQPAAAWAQNLKVTLLGTGIHCP